MDTNSIQAVGLAPTQPLQLPQPASNRNNPRLQDTAAALSSQPLRQGINQPPVASEREIATEEIETSVEAMNDFVKTINSDLKFSIDEDTGKTVVKVIDQATDQVLRQIPSEEVLAIAKALDKLKGLLIHQKA